MKDSRWLFQREPFPIPKTPQGVRSFPIHLGALMQLVMSPWKWVLWCQWKEPKAEQGRSGDGYVPVGYDNHTQVASYSISVFISLHTLVLQNTSLTVIYPWKYDFWISCFFFTQKLPGTISFNSTQHLSPCLRSFDHQRKYRECPWLHPHFLCFITVDQYSNLRRRKNGRIQMIHRFYLDQRGLRNPFNFFAWYGTIALEPGSNLFKTVLEGTR